LLVIFTITALTISSCKKDEPYKSDAELIGFDNAMCPCCGGIKITIDNVPNPNGNTCFLVGQLPANFILGANSKFPITVKVDWKIDTAHCFGNYIGIIRIARR